MLPSAPNMLLGKSHELASFKAPQAFTAPESDTEPKALMDDFGAATAAAG
jgi:hypothetical protein